MTNVNRKALMKLAPEYAAEISAAIPLRLEAGRTFGYLGLKLAFAGRVWQWAKTSEWTDALDVSLVPLWRESAPLASVWNPRKESVETEFLQLLGWKRGEFSHCLERPNMPEAFAGWVKGLPIEALELSTRLAKAMRSDGKVTVGGLLTISESELLRTPNLGRKSVNELRACLAGIGFFPSADSLYEYRKS